MTAIPWTLFHDIDISGSRFDTMTHAFAASHVLRRVPGEIFPLVPSPNGLFWCGIGS